MQQLKNIYHLILALFSSFWYGFPARQMTVIGITGTDGKTTTTHLIFHILKTSHLPVSYISTVEANIMGKKYDTGFHVTTPAPWQLQKFIKMARDAGSQYLILEVTSHALDQFRHFGTSIDIAVITNISHEHLDYHKSLEKYRFTKAKLLKGAKYSVLNADDANINYLRKKAEGKIIRYSLKDYPKIQKIIGSVNPNLIGRYNRYNILASIAVARILNIDYKLINNALTTFPGVPGRLEEVKSRKPFKIYIDFAHKINALKQVLTTVRQITAGRVIAVFGAAGLRDHLKRPVMGKVAADMADLTVLTAEDPRTEDVRDIINQIARGLLTKGAVEMNKNVNKLNLQNGKKYFFRIPDRQEAINFAVRKLAKKGDTVIVCGKGHEKSMCYYNTEYPWDEKQAVLKALYGSVKNSKKGNIN